jgi:cation transport ATPase
MAEADLLRYAASAFRHLADERTAALIEACRSHRTHLLDLPALGLEGGVTVAHGDRKVKVREYAPASDPGGVGPLAVEADGSLIGLVEFARNGRPAAASAVRRLREAAGVPIALVSDRPPELAASLASSLGVDAHQGGLSAGDVDLLLSSFRSRGLRAVVVGEGAGRLGAMSGWQGFASEPQSSTARPDRGSQANPCHPQVAIDLGGDVASSGADAVLLRPDLDGLAGLWDVARAHAGGARRARRFILVPNLLCVTGAFFFGATSLTAVVISNLGTLGLYGRAVGSLRATERPGLARR